MAGMGKPNRRAKAAVSLVSGGLLVMIWSGVWYAAITSRRSEATAQALIACRLVFLAGLLMSGSAFVYLRRRRLSVVDGSTTHPSLPPDTGSLSMTATRQTHLRV